MKCLWATPDEQRTLDGDCGPLRREALARVRGIGPAALIPLGIDSRLAVAAEALGAVLTDLESDPFRRILMGAAVTVAADQGFIEVEPAD